jgi:hypothetical protein
MEHEEFKRQHLEFVQNVITRMASNSFQIKGFTMVMATLLAGLWGESKNILFLWLVIPATIMCALVDAYYLQLERKYRELYKRSVEQLEKKQSLAEIYDMDVRSISHSYWSCLFSKSMVMPYLTILLLIVGVVLVHYGIGSSRLCVR